MKFDVHSENDPGISVSNAQSHHICPTNIANNQLIVAQVISKNSIVALSMSYGRTNYKIFRELQIVLLAEETTVNYGTFSKGMIRFTPLVPKHCLE